jgi:hypothetical protein
MKTLLSSLCIALLIPLGAQAQTTPAKTPSKKATPPAAEPAKPKVRLMTRDQLRRCINLKSENATEAAGLNKDKAAFEADYNALLSERASFIAKKDEREATAKAILAENAALSEETKELQKPVERSEREAMEERRKAYNLRVAAIGKRIDEYNAGKDAMIEQSKKLQPLLDAIDARKTEMNRRIEDHQLALEEWQVECSNKPYAEADEAAIMKEKASK